MKKLALSFSAIFLLASTGTALAGDWPQYRGPNHDGISTEKLPLKKRPAGGLPVVWKVPTENGFSSFAIGGGKVFTLVRRDIEGVAREICIALDAATGKEQWSAPLAIAKYDQGGDSAGGGDGPRSTPSYDDGKVYVLDSTLVLTCLDAADGKTLWTHDIVQEYSGKLIAWQSAASPLVEGGLVFVMGGDAGQGLLAFDKKTGEVAWKAHDDKITHATPVAATILGTRQVIFFTQTGLVSVVPESGAVLWRHPFPYNTSTAASPVVDGDIVYCSAGYGVGAGACRVSKNGDTFSAAELWRKSNQLPNHWSTPFAKDGYLYGMFSFKEYGKGPLKCIELATGKEMWSQSGFGAGNCMLIDGCVLALTDKGEIVLAEATPKAYTELARQSAVGGKCWSAPAFSDGKLFVRSTTEGACLAAGPGR